MIFQLMRGHGDTHKLSLTPLYVFKTTTETPNCACPQARAFYIRIGLNSIGVDIRYVQVNEYGFPANNPDTILE